jgi:tight adherence protein B
MKERAEGPARTVDALAAGLGEVAALAAAGLAPEVCWEPLLGPAGLGAAAQGGVVPVGDGLPAWQAELAAAHGPTADVARLAGAVVAVWRVSDQVGAPLGDLLKGLERVVEEYQAAADARGAALAGPKASARLLRYLPVLGLVMGTALGADPCRVLLDGGVGSIALGVGVALLVAGGLWSKALVGRAARPPDLDVPVAALIVAACLKAGLSLPAALATVGRVWPAGVGAGLGRVGEQLARGAAWDLAWAAPFGWGRAGSVGAGAVRSGGAGRRAAAGRRGWLGGVGRSGGRRPGALEEVPAAAAWDGLERALRLAWENGVAAGPLLAGLRQRLARQARREAADGAARLGVALMLPLGLCYLPAFLALGLVPVVLSIAAGFAFAI